MSAAGRTPNMNCALYMLDKLPSGNVPRGGRSWTVGQGGRKWSVRDEIDRGLERLAEEREKMAQELRMRLATRIVPIKASSARQASASSTQPHAAPKAVLHADQLIELVKAHPGCTAHDVAKRVKRSYGTVYEQLCRLDKASQLRRELGGGTKPARFYPI